MTNSTPPPVSGQPEPQETNGFQHVSGPALELIVSAARESFDGPTLRRLAAAFDTLAGEKEGEA